MLAFLTTDADVPRALMQKLLQLASDETFNTLNVDGAFSPGTVVRDQYGGSTATVSASGSVTLTPDPNGVVLLEKDGAAATPFTWSDATVYFVITDRFFNGDPSNDHAYGRAGDGAAAPGGDQEAFDRLLNAGFGT